ncbi:MAG: tRNA dihydrouridine synthase DusB, partial [Planctomycetota bacterium]|nr:tRNA dihydrouridine synthase DusB [Planctomycetota bacterium]
MSSQTPQPLCYGSLRLPSRWHLSPLAGFTNLPFRRVVREIGGVGLATTDLVNARALVEGSEKTFELTETHPTDSPFAVQIFGHDPQVMRDAAQILEGRGVDSIDINMGCPVDHVTRTGAGSKLMCDPNTTVVRLVRTVLEAVRLPVTVKMRLGWDETRITAPRFAREFEQVGVAAIAIHGRTRAQGFTGIVNLDGIRQVVEAIEAIPVVGNGDVRTVEDAVHMRRVTGCHAVSIGRGALANPWIFRQLVEHETTGSYGPPGSFDDRLRLLLRQFSYLEERHGSEKAVVRFRKMAHWYAKSMRVRASLRHRLQIAKTREEFTSAVEAIAVAG